MSTVPMSSKRGGEQRSLHKRRLRQLAFPTRWDGPLHQAFKHFLTLHIRFDSDPEQGHAALCRHLTPYDRVRPLWAEFRQMLTEAAPQLIHRLWGDPAVTHGRTSL